MPKAAYPTSSDLQTYLLAAGFSSTLVASLDLSTLAVAGRLAWEKQAGRVMLAVSGTRAFQRPEGPRGVLNLRDDLLPSPAPSITDNDTALTVNEAYVFEPLDAAGRGVPYQRVRFWRLASSYPHTIAPPLEITGSWGYGTTIPDDAWLGMMAMAALELHPQLAQAITGGIEAWQEADMMERYGDQPLRGLAAGWLAQVQRTAGAWDEKGVFRVGRYTRVTVG